MNKVTLSVAALAALAPVYAQAAEELTEEEQKAALDAKKAAIASLRLELNNAANYIQANCPDVKDEWLLSISRIEKQLEDLYNDNENYVMPDVEALSGLIEGTKQSAIDAQKPYTSKHNLDAAYAPLKNLYEDAIAQCGNGNYPHIGKDKADDIKELDVVAIGETIAAFDLTQQDICAQENSIIGQIATATASIKNLMKNIDNEEKAVADNESAHNTVDAAYKAAKAEYNKQLQLAISSIPTPIYKDWQDKVIEDLNEQFRIIDAAYKKDAEAYGKGESGEYMEENVNDINTALGKVQTLVDNKVKDVNKEEDAKVKADGTVTELQNKLDDIKKQLDDRGLTQCNADINEIQGLINTLKSNIEAQYKDHTLSTFSYGGDVIDIKSKTNDIDDNKDHGYLLVISNYDCYTNVLSPAIEALQKKIDDARDAAKAALSDDGKYEAATYYEKQYNTICNLIKNSLRTPAKTAFDNYKAEDFNANDYPGLETKVNTNISEYVTQTADALVAYNTAIAYIDAQQALLDKLNGIEGLDKTVTEDGSFPANAGVKTYETIIEDLQKEIDAINAKITASKALSNLDHLDKLKDAADDKLTKDIQTLIDNYPAKKMLFDQNSSISAANAVLDEAQKRITELSDILATVVGNPAGTWGNKTTEVTTEKANLMEELDRIQDIKDNAKNDFDAVPVGTDEDGYKAKQDAAAKAIATLAEVKDILDGTNQQSSLDDDIKTFVANQAAYLEIEALANGYVDDATTPLTAKTLSDLMEYVMNNSTDPATAYYQGEVTKLIQELAKIDSDVDSYYDSKSCVEKKQEVLDRITELNGKATNLKNAVIPNENAHRTQVQNVTTLQGTWDTVYYKISENDESTTAADWLKDLAKIQEQINALSAMVEEEFGKGNSKASNDNINALIKEYEGAINTIATAQYKGYAAQIKKDNKDVHDAFEAKWNNANEKFSEAIVTLNTFSAIQNQTIKDEALANLVDAHDDIYAYADKLRQLKYSENEKYKKYLVDDVDGVDDVYDATDDKATADQYWQEIDRRLKDYQDAVNKVAVQAFASAVSSAQNNVNYFKLRISAFEYSDKETAFDDVQNIIDKIIAAGVTDADGGTTDRMYAANVDGWTTTLNNISSMLYADFNAACDAERDYQIGIVETLYNSERNEIAEFKEIDNQSYLDKLDALKVTTIDAARNNYYQNENYIASMKNVLASYYGNDRDATHSDIYTSAYNSSAANKANVAAYNDIKGWLAAVNTAATNAETLIKSMYIGHTDVCYTGGKAVTAQLDALLAEVEGYAAQVEIEKEIGGCVSYKSNVEARIKADGSIYTEFNQLKAFAVKEEIEALVKKIDLVKEEYNQNAKDDLESVKEYDQKITDLYGALLTNSEAGTEVKTSIQWKWNNGKLTVDAAATELAKHEVNIANLGKELTDKYDKEAVAWNAAAAEIQAEIDNIEPSMVQAEGWANYNQATKDGYLELVEGLRGEFELVKANNEAKANAGTLLFYKDAILFDLASVKADIPQAYNSSLWAEYNKQKTNDDMYDDLLRDLDDRKTELQERYDRIKDFKYRAKTYTGQDYINYQHNLLENSLNTLGEWLESDHNNVDLAYGCNTANQINNMQNSIYELECSATKTEMDGIINELNQSIDDSKTNMIGKLYGGTRESDLENEYARIKDLLGKAYTFHDQLKTTYVSVDVDGNQILSYYGYPITKHVNYLDDTEYGVNSLQARLAELKESADQLAKDVVELAYMVGDADNDKLVTVNDYSEVRGWILTAKKFDDVSEAKRYAGDVNGDKEFTVGDMTAISNIIFHEDWNWSSSASSARARATASTEDKLTVASESEETTIFGKTVRMAVSLDNVEAFTAGQMDIILPQGMKLAGQSLSSRANGHELLANEIAGGTYRLVASTVENNAFNGSNGALIYLDVEVGSDYNGGNITIDNVIFSDAQANSYYLTNNGPIVPTGIEGIEAASVKERIYSVGGQMMKAVKKGINIIVGENNNTKKVVK